MVTSPEHVLGNYLLASLPDDERERMLPHLNHVVLPNGEMLFNATDPIKQVYFPITGAISIVSLFEDGSTVEVGVAGNEGMVGIPVVLGINYAPNRCAIAQITGKGLLMRADALRREFKRGGQLHNLLLRYTHAFLTQVSQTAACNRRHHVKERLARWLLVCQDRVMTNELNLTHEAIASMLGLRRAGITEACGVLEQEGLLHCGRGLIKLLDRKALEDAACECYGVVKEEFDRLYHASSLV